MRRGLLYCMEYLEESLSDWLGEELQVAGASLDFPGAPLLIWSWGQLHLLTR